MYHCEKIIQKPGLIAKSFESSCKSGAVPAAGWTGKKIRGRDSDGFRSRLLLRADLVAVIPIDRRIGSGIVGDFARCWFVQFSLRALLFFLFVFFFVFFLFLALLEC